MTLALTQPLTPQQAPIVGENGAPTLEFYKFLQQIASIAGAPAVVVPPQVDLTPSGTIGFFAGSAAPTGWLKANGAAVSRTTFAALFTAIGTTYGVGDGSTTFGLPDMRGNFVRAFDDGRGVDTGRVLGSSQTDAMQGHKHQVSPADGLQSIGNNSASDPVVTFGAPTNTYTTTSPITDGVNGTPRTAAETRPVNVALLCCIKT